MGEERTSEGDGRMLDLSGRVALVTGAARGLGAAHAVELARRGAAVVAADRLDAGETVERIEAAGGEAAGLVIDLGADGAASAALAATVGRFDRLDVLVNNAGLLRDRISFNLDPADWDLVLDVNLGASFRLAQAAARHWRAAGEGGVITNTSSESGLYGNVGQVNYAAAKAGVAAMTITMAAELERLGIRVNAIAPRARTPMSDEAFGELPGAADFDPFGAEHVAAFAAWLASDAATGVSGQVFVVHGAGVEVMETWHAARTAPRWGEWTDSELARLRERLFPEGDPDTTLRSVGALFLEPELKGSR